MDHAKDHWTLKTGYFEDPNPAIQVQTLPLEGPRSLGYRTNCKKFSTCVLPSCSSQVTKSPLCALKGDHTHLSPVRTPRDPGETRRRRRIQMHRNRWVLPKNVPKKTVRSNKTGGWTNPSEKYKSKFVHLPQSSGWKLKKKWVDWVPGSFSSLTYPRKQLFTPDQPTTPTKFLTFHSSPWCALPHLLLGSLRKHGRNMEGLKQQIHRNRIGVRRVERKSKCLCVQHGHICIYIYM